MLIVICVMMFPIYILMILSSLVFSFQYISPVCHYLVRICVFDIVEILVLYPRSIFFCNVFLFSGRHFSFFFHEIN